MNLFGSIRKDYGQDHVKGLREFERSEVKLARFRNHLRLTLRCKSEGITPPSLKLNSSIKTSNAKLILQHAEKQLTRERIRIINNKITTLYDSITKQKEKFKAKFPDDVYNDVISFGTRRYESEHEKVKARHVSKINKLCERLKKDCTSGDLSGTLLKKWVINKSNKELTNEQVSVLAKWLNYAVSPNTLPVEEIIVKTELVCSKMDPSEAAELRTEIAGAVKSSSPPKSNLSKCERKAQQELRKDDSIIILPADKGRATVVLDKAEYEPKAITMLSDDNTYVKLKKDPTDNYKRKLIAILSRFKKEGKLDEATYKRLYLTAAIIPKFYALPKIHKPGTPLRPIVSSIGAVTYRTAKFLGIFYLP